MPDAFRLLIEQAALKRDTAIKAARLEFKETMKQLRNLQLQMGGERVYAIKAKNRSIEAAIKATMPRDRTFTMKGLIELMHAAEPGRKFHEPTVRSIIQRMGDKNELRRVKRYKGQVLWAAADCPTPEVPFDSRPMVDVLEATLREMGPKPVADTCLTFQGKGCQADTNPLDLLKSILGALRRRRDIFEWDGTAAWGDGWARRIVKRSFMGGYYFGDELFRRLDSSRRQAYHNVPSQTVPKIRPNQRKTAGCLLKKKRAMIAAAIMLPKIRKSRISLLDASFGWKPRISFLRWQGSARTSRGIVGSVAPEWS